MEDLKKLRNICNSLHLQRREEVKLVLEEWLENYFLNGNRAWRAFVGKKHLRPIPINRDFSIYKSNSSYENPHNNRQYFQWPDLPDAEIKEIIEGLGFVVSGPRLCLALPASEKGKSLTFAQKWVKRINDNYSKYVDTEKKLARHYYHEVIDQLCNIHPTKIVSREGYTVFLDFKFDSELKLSRICVNRLRRLLHDARIEEYYDENSKYLGMRVFDA